MGRVSRVWSKASGVPKFLFFSRKSACFGRQFFFTLAWSRALSKFNTCAVLIILSTAIHIVAHVFNVEFFVDSHKSNNTLIERLNNMEDFGNESYLNPIRDSNAVSSIHFVCFSLLIRTDSNLVLRAFSPPPSQEKGPGNEIGPTLKLDCMSSVV